MRKYSFLIVSFFAILLLFSCRNKKMIGVLKNGAEVCLLKNKDNKWELAVNDKSLAAVSSSSVCGIELFKSEDSITEIMSGYDSFQKTNDGFIGQGKINASSVEFIFNDHWKINENILTLHRIVKVQGSHSGGFLSSVELQTKQPFNRDSIGVFAPGMIYKGVKGLTDSAIGGKDLYVKGKGILWIREDRLPAPLLGFHAGDQSSLAVLNTLPDGRTCIRDSRDLKCVTVIDSNIHVGALGLTNRNNYFSVGYHYPCTEGEYTYSGGTYPNGQKHQWRRRYHPIVNGFVQTYTIAFKFSQEKTFAEFYSNTWRWAWKMLKPQVIHQNIELLKQCMLDMLSEKIITTNGRSGIPNFITSAKYEHYDYDRRTILGFVGKALEVSNFLLIASHDTTNKNAKKYEEQAHKIMDSFVKTISLNPPAGEGFNMETGQVSEAFVAGQVFLRSYGDDLKAMTKALLREGPESYHYKEYLAWVSSFTDWLLTQQNVEGGFPRKWKARTGEVVEKSAASSYNAVPLLVLMSKATGDKKYFDAAVKAAEYCWNSGQSSGVFVGGTIDNPNVIDKEAGTLSLEAYLILFETTKDKKWLDRARMAANFAETWIYAWNVPMPADENDSTLHWKKSCNTTGLQLIASGHSLVDAYMCFDVDEFAQMAAYTGDKHYMDVARILLHNTKQMIAIPGRPYDLNGPGWQQEHWSIAPMRGYGLHRGWLPWVTTSQLNGILGLQEFDKKIFNSLIK